jgi:hypothetical protein
MKKTALTQSLILIILFSTAGMLQLTNFELEDCFPPTAHAALASSSNSESPQLLWNKTYSVWNQTAGENVFARPEAIIQANDRGYVIVGETNGSSSADWYDFWVVKTDSSGNVEWEKTFGGPYGDFAYSVIQTSDGGFAIAGNLNDEAWVVKADSAGNMQWNRTYSETIDGRAYSIIQTSDGGYAIAGEVGNWYSRIFWLAKTDELGYAKWSKTYETVVYGQAVSVIQTRDGGYALVGYSNSEDFLLVKTDSLGELEWSKTYGSGDKDYGHSVVQTSDGGFVLSGLLWNRSGTGSAGLIKTDSSGNELWKKNYPGGSPGVMVGTSDGGYALCSSEALVKTDSEGNMLWVIDLNGGSSVVQTSDGGYAITGNAVLPSSDGQDFISFVWIVKTEATSPTPTPKPSPTSTPTISPTLTPDEGNRQLKQWTTIFGVVIIALAVAASLLVYFKKRKR